MPDQYSPDADDQMPEKKSSQQLLLLLLLLLVGVFAYLYFFTGLIKPREEQPKPQPVAEAPVKKPLPPRPQPSGTEAAQPAAPTAAKAEAPKAAAPGQPGQPAKPVAPAAAAAKPAAPAKEAAAAKPAAGAPAAKPAQPAAQHKPAQPAAAAQQAKPVKPVPPAVAQAKGAHPAAPAKEAKVEPAKKPVTKPAAKATTEAKGAQKPAAAEKAAAAPAKKVVKAASPAYALEINGDLATSELGPTMAKLKQAGIGNVVKTKLHKGEPMHRLFLADFADRNEALEELERLKLAAPSAFMLKENGRYAVYGGSYLREAKAASEQDRLVTKGVKLMLKSATAPVEVLKVRAGSFPDRAKADKAAKALKKAGLEAKVVKVAKVEK